MFLYFDIQRMKREGSPIKIKDYFTNPIHKIRQASFLEVGFTQDHLNTFVKAFTNRHSSRHLSFTAIRQFIQSFTNHNPQLTESYQQFFKNNFKISDYQDILLQQFVQFFTRDQGSSIDNLTPKGQQRIYKQLGQFTQENIVDRCKELDIPMSSAEAGKMIKMINWHSGSGKDGKIGEEAFRTVLNAGQKMLQD